MPLIIIAQVRSAAALRRLFREKLGKLLNILIVAPSNPVFWGDSGKAPVNCVIVLDASKAGMVDKNHYTSRPLWRRVRATCASSAKWSGISYEAAVPVFVDRANTEKEIIFRHTLHRKCRDFADCFRVRPNR